MDVCSLPGLKISTLPLEFSIRWEELSNKPVSKHRAELYYDGGLLCHFAQMCKGKVSWSNKALFCRSSQRSRQLWLWDSILMCCVFFYMLKEYEIQQWCDKWITTNKTFTSPHQFLHSFKSCSRSTAVVDAAWSRGCPKKVVGTMSASCARSLPI